jgi:hypothetical protein
MGHAGENKKRKEGKNEPYCNARGVVVQAFPDPGLMLN